jgi:flagellar hook-basal body complex protein FliE
MTVMPAAAGLSAYRAVAAGTPGQGLAGAAAGDGFADALQRAMDDTVQAGRAADEASVAAINGTTGTTEVVMAVTRAELALQTAVALRDRVVAAYQDVMRMQI